MRFGPFQFLEPLASGGMGQVWRGEHVRQGVPVAIKVARTSNDAKAIRALRREIRTMARLVHPRIVVILDHGSISTETASASGGRLAAGGPAFVMELGRHPLPMHLRRHGANWSFVHDLILQVLDGLAHGHARGVIHRDLKPSNLIGFGDDWKLADFGISCGVGDAQASEIVGTPGYMAPEQIRGHSHDIGPPTDLYALGCLAWRVATGSTPFSGGHEHVLGAHLTRPVGRFQPRLSVPPALEGWMRRCLAKAPEQRFYRAADAAWSLPKLASEGSPNSQSHPEGSPQVALSMTHTLVKPTRPRERPPASQAAVEPVPDSSPPIPTDWRRAARERSAPRLLDAGQALFGLRDHPMVGRDCERDQLWAEWRRSAAGELRVVAVQGTAGLGKSRLAEWLCRRVHEVGGGDVLRCLHSLDGGRDDGLAAMVERGLRARDASRERFCVRVRQVFPGFDLLGESELVELIRPRGRNDALYGLFPVRLTKASDRHRALSRVFEAWSSARPVLLFVDDAQWGASSLDFVAHLQDEMIDRPILVVLTIRTEALEAAARTKVARLQDEMIDLQPLRRDERSQLIRDLLCLSPQLASHVEDRTEGHPLFAVQLVGDWVELGVLTVSPEGFRLATGFEAPIPESIDSLWARRIDRVLAGVESDENALELAATLGQRVDDAEWGAACTRAQLTPSPELVDRLHEQGLVRGDQPWSFVHGLLVESLLARARRADRHQANCKVVLAVLEDRGLALAAAGQSAQAQAPLARAVALAERDLPAAWPRMMARLGNVRRMLGQVETAEADLGAALSAARARDDSSAEAAVLAVLGVVLGHRGQMSEATAALEAALAGHQRLGDRAGEGIVWSDLGNAYKEQGRLTDAVACYKASLLLHRETGNLRFEAIALGNLATVQHFLGEVEASRLSHARALNGLEQCGDRRNQAALLGNLGYLRLGGGDLQGAEESFRKALAIHIELGGPHDQAQWLIGLGGLKRLHGEYEVAKGLLSQALSLLDGASARSGSTALGIRAEIELESGDPVSARSSALEALSLAEAVGDPLRCGQLQSLLAELETDPKRQQERLRTAHRLITDTGHATALAIHTCRHARIAIRAGHVAAGQRALDKAIALAGSSGDHVNSPPGRQIAQTRKLLATVTSV